MCYLGMLGTLEGWKSHHVDYHWSYQSEIPSSVGGSLVSNNHYVVITDLIWVHNLFVSACSDGDSKGIWSVAKPCLGWSGRVFER